MPALDEPKRKRGDRKKSGCGSCTCCFSHRIKKIKEEQPSENNVPALMVAPTDPTTYPPFVDDLPDISTPGSCISIQGAVKPDCTRFAVNLMTGRDPDKSDIALHINPRLSLRYVVRNSKVNGTWAEEETTSITKFDLDRNKNFDLDVVVTEREFLVAANGKHICGFVFRIPISKVKVLQVEGAVKVSNVEYRKVEIYPQPSPQNAPFTVPTGDGHDPDAVQQLEMPLTAVLPRGFQQGWQLEIYGRVKILPHAFYINLQEGAQLWPHPIVPLHLNPRFRTKYGKHLFVRNAWIDDGWGPEERSPGFQFSAGAPFSVAIRKADDHFSVWVDGQLAGEFKFRDGHSNVDTLYVHGDVIVKSVYMRQKIDDKYFNRSQENVRPTSL